MPLLRLKIILCKITLEISSLNLHAVFINTAAFLHIMDFITMGQTDRFPLSSLKENVARVEFYSSSRTRPLALSTGAPIFT